MSGRRTSGRDGRVRVAAVLPTLGNGGAERSTVQAIDPLRSRGVDVEIVTLRGAPGPLEDQARERGVLRVLDTSVSPAGVLALRKTLRHLRPDIVHTAVFDADIVGRAAATGSGAAVLTSLVTTAYDEQRRRDPAVERWKLEVARFAEAVSGRLLNDRFHAISETTRSAAVDHLRLPAERIDVIPRGRSSASLGRRSPQRRLRAREHFGLRAETDVVLAVGREEWTKAHDVLIEAMPAIVARRPDVQLVIAGRPGRSSASLDQLVTDLGLGTVVRRLGHVEDVAELMSAADVLAFPSRYEGLGGTLIEAMALELPIVAAACAAVVETLGGTGVLVDIDAPDQLASAVCRVLDDTALATGLTVLGRGRFERFFEAEVIMDRTAELYHRVAATS